MGFMDNLKAQLGNALAGVTGEQGGVLNGVMGMINSHPGGLAGLVQTCEKQGLGGVCRSWIGTGPNQTITPEQIQQVLGNEKIQAFAREHNIDMNQVSTQLAQFLPMVIDKMTPSGTIPATGQAPAAPAAPATGS
jgi:uncharacterized protein YidB (DUF937 family)